MARYPIGQPVRLSTTVKDLTGTLVDAGAITLTLTKPDATTQAYAFPVHDSLGAYHQDIPAADMTTIGRYLFKWVTTGTGAGAVFGEYDVYDQATYPEIISLADAKEQLNITATNGDAELSAFIQAASQVVEGYVGAVGRRTVTATVRGGYSIALPTYPVISLTSMTAAASGVVTYGDMSGFDVNTTTGVIRLLSGLHIDGPQRVVYVAGRAVVPPDITLATRVIVQHLWSTQRGGSTRPGMGGSGDITDQQLVLAGFAIPRRAVELLRGSIQPGFA